MEWYQVLIIIGSVSGVVVLTQSNISKRIDDLSRNVHLLLDKLIPDSDSKK